MSDRPPQAIVLKVGEGYRIAVPFELRTGPHGQVWVYSFAVGRPYATESKAVSDASLIVARTE